MRRPRLLPQCIKTLVVGALVLAPGNVAAQQLDVVRGRVIGPLPESAPIVDAAVSVVSRPGGVTRATRTDADGRFTVTFPASGDDFLVSALAIGFAPRRTELKRFGSELLFLELRLERPIPEMDTLEALGDRRRAPRDARATPDLGGTEQTVNQFHVPTDRAGTLDALAGSIPGVQLITRADGTSEGFSVLGLGSDQNSVTLNGVAFGESAIPRDARVGASVTTAPFDPSRGGFSGAELALATQRGNNFHSGTMSVLGDAPQLQWSDRAATGLGTRYGNLSVGGRHAGPIRFDRAFYDVSYQVSRRMSDARNILSADAEALRATGVAADSVARLVGIVGTLGIPGAVPGLGASRTTDRALLLADVSLVPPTSSGHALSLVVHGGVDRSDPIAISTSALPTVGGTERRWSGGAQIRHTNYFGSGLLTETTLSAAGSQSSATPFVLLPGGDVRVESEFEDAPGSIRRLSFGGNAGLRRLDATRTFAGQSGLSFYTRDGRHRIRLLGEARATTYRDESAADLLGTFTFPTLEDLELGRPSSFVRTLNGVATSGEQYVAALSLGDVFQATRGLRIQSGVRIDGFGFGSAPPGNAALRQSLGLRNDAVPSGWFASPRFGFTWRAQTSRRIAPSLAGGIGLFQGIPSVSLLEAALRNTGLPDGSQVVECVGDAVPTPDWPSYVANPHSVPDRCTDGTTGVPDEPTPPRVSMFAPNWKPARSLRASLEWTQGILGDHLELTASGLYSRNSRQSAAVDRNFAGVPAFSLTGEMDRPVFVPEPSIVPETGAIDWIDARVTQQFSRVMETQSSLRSDAQQLMVSLRPSLLNYRVGWNLSYVHSRIRQELSGFTSTAGDPRDTEWSRSPMDARHQISFGLALNVADWVRLDWFTSMRSGLPFTPMIGADVNGDGFANDRAFVFDPALAPVEIRDGLRDLLDRGSPEARRCLSRQLGRIAGQSSCEGRWRSSALLSATLNPVKLGISPRALVTVQLSNPLGAADLLLHGSNGLRGWGGSSSPDPTLLHVTGFDAAARRFTYAVNPRFGTSRPGLTPFRSPVRLTVAMRLELSPARDLQSLSHLLRRGRGRAGSREPASTYRTRFGTGGIDNPFYEILSRREWLALNNDQANRLAQLNTAYRATLDSIWRPLAAYFGDLPETYAQETALDRYLKARHATVDVLMKLAPEIRAVLTARQLRRLPLPVARLLDARYLAAIRDGSITPFADVLNPGDAGLANPLVGGTVRFTPGG